MDQAISENTNTDNRATRIWIEAFIEAVIGGHSGKTQQLVTALQGSKSQAIPAGLLADLETGNAVARNRVLRRWLEKNKKQAADDWISYGFPKPTAAYSAAVVLDFDQDLRDAETGLVHLVDAEKRVFGGSERAGPLWRLLSGQLDELLEEIRHQPGMALAVVSRNSRHIIEKALAMERFSQHACGKQGPCLLRHFTPGLIFGFEDFNDDTPKSQVIREKIMLPQELGCGDVFFVDDMMMNISDVRRACGVQVLHVAGGGGMGPQHFDAIRHWLAVKAREHTR
jgi:hypothetical protein